MRAGLWRAVLCGALLAGAVAFGSAQPMPVPAPAPKEVDTAAERAKLQAELLALLKRMSAAGPMPPPAAPPPSAVTPGKGKTDVPAGKVPDAVREAMNLFRDGDFEAARRAFGLINTDVLPKEDKAFVRYMLASSYRRLGKPAEAEVIYREVANSGDDEFLAGYASQQLYLIGSERDLQSQLEQLRARAKSK